LQQALGHGGHRALGAAHLAVVDLQRQAVSRQPFMVGGTDRFDTLVMEALGERLFCKVGAEGVYCAALPELGLGLALKIDDGQVRGAESAMAAVAEGLLQLDEVQAALLRGYSDMPLNNWRGVHVGQVRASEVLRAAIRRR